MHKTRLLLLTGAPGTGKTTLLRKVAQRLPRLRATGFTTEEIREAGVRVGFRIVPLGRGPCPERIMARTDEAGGGDGPRVGRYLVDVAAIDAVAERALAFDPDVDVYLVDEIGRMECFSAQFVGSLRALLDSDRIVVATIARRVGAFIAEVKARRDAELREVTRQNREGLVDTVLDWIGART